MERRIGSAKTVQRLRFKVPGDELLTPSPQAETEAKASFLNAIAIAQQQQAKLWELRTVMGLSQLRQQQVMQHRLRNTQHVLQTVFAQAYQMLSEVYG